MDPLTRATSSRPRPRTSTERGRRYREKRKIYENALKQKIKALHEEIARLRSSRSLCSQQALLLKASPHSSLVLLTRELYTILRNGLEAMDSHSMASCPIDAAARKLSAMQYKENFLRRVLDPEVVWGDLVGVDAAISQWRRHTSSFSKFELELGDVDVVNGSETNPIVTIRTKLHARFSHESLPGMFPFALDRQRDLVERLVDRDMEFECVSRFQFSERRQILTYTGEISYVETLLRALGSARDVAELMQLSLVTPHATLMDEVRLQGEDADLARESFSDDGRNCLQHLVLFDSQERNGFANPGGVNLDEDMGSSPEGAKLSVRYLLDQDHEEEQKLSCVRDIGVPEPLLEPGQYQISGQFSQHPRAWLFDEEGDDDDDGYLDGAEDGFESSD